MNSKKGLPTRYIVLATLVVAAIIFGFIANAVNEDRKLNILESAVKDTVLFVNKIVTAPFKWAGSEYKKYQEEQDLYKKYQELKKQVEQIDLNKAQILELQTEIKKYQDLLNINNTLMKSDYLNVSVIDRNVGYWYNNITVDKGTNSGVKVGMAVINNYGLVGKVIKTSNFNSVIKLLTTDEIENKISVKIKLDNKDVYGLLVGYNQVKNTFTVEGIDQNVDLKVGSTVMTTGLGGVFPSGVLVGYVKSVTSDNFGLAKIVEVTSLVDFDDLSYLTILKRSAND